MRHASYARRRICRQMHCATGAAPADKRSVGRAESQAHKLARAQTSLCRLAPCGLASRRAQLHSPQLSSSLPRDSLSVSVSVVYLLPLTAWREPSPRLLARLAQQACATVRRTQHKCLQCSAGAYLRASVVGTAHVRMRTDAANQVGAGQSRARKQHPWRRHWQRCDAANARARARVTALMPPLRVSRVYLSRLGLQCAREWVWPSEVRETG